MPERSFPAALVRESIRSGTLAALAMMPFGLLFRVAGLRVGYYGPKLGALLFGGVPEPGFQALLLIQHFVIGWISAAPLLLVLAASRTRVAPLLQGAAYGAAYYVVVNSLLLPFVFGDRTPWQLGVAFVWPSLAIHLVFGACVALAATRFLALHARKANAG
jgi:hypothetical protein